MPTKILSSMPDTFCTSSEIMATLALVIMKQLEGSHLGLYKVHKLEPYIDF